MESPTQGANRVEGGDTWLEMGAPVAFVRDPRLTVLFVTLLIICEERKQSQSSFKDKKKLLLPTRRGPILP